jgi:hypothetical protein
MAVARMMIIKGTAKNDKRRDSRDNPDKSHKIDGMVQLPMLTSAIIRY